MKYYLETVCTTITEFFKLWLTWPGIFLIFILIFQRELSRLLDRLKFIGIGDKRAEFEQKEQTAGIEETIKELKELEDELKTAKNASEKEKLELTKTLFFEKTYTLIFRSQIEVLRELRKYKQQGLRWNNIMKLSFPALSLINFSNFMSFLQNSGLISWELIENNSDAIVRIALLGEEFLDYIDSRGYNVFTKAI